MEIVDEIQNDLYRRLEARRVAIVELDKKIKIEKLLAVQPVNSTEEIDQLISEANQIVFSTGHRHVPLMAGRVNEISEEFADQWDIFFSKKEKQEELKRPKTIRVYQKDKDKGKGKVGGPPSLNITDNLPPPPSYTPLVHTIDKQLATKSMETPHEDTNPESEILYTMNIDTQEVNIVVDKETTGGKKKDVATEPLAIDVEIGIETQTEQSVDPKPTQLEQQTDKLVEISVVDCAEVHTKKPAVNTET